MKKKKVTREPNGYERLYMTIFEVDSLDKMSLPVDYKESIKLALETLTEKERTVISLRYSIDSVIVYTYKDIASILGVSNSYVGVIHNTAIRKLRHPSRRSILVDGAAEYTIRKNTVDKIMKAYEEKIQEAFEDIEGKFTIPVVNDVDSIDINTLPFSRDEKTALNKADIHTISEIKELGHDGLVNIHGIGDAKASHIMRIVELEEDVVRRLSDDIMYKYA